VIAQTFSINGDEIIRGEDFSHANKPSLTFNPARGTVYVNAACLKRLPDMEYALLVISSREKRLSILPCDTSELDGVRLRSAGTNRNQPRHIRCRDNFTEDMLTLMQWSRGYRYRMIGYLAVGERDTIVAFDLPSAEVFRVGGGSTDRQERVHSGFGSVYDEQRKSPLIRTVTQDTEIVLEDTEGNKNHDNR